MEKQSVMSGWMDAPWSKCRHLGMQTLSNMYIQYVDRISSDSEKVRKVYETPYRGTHLSMGTPGM